MKSDLKLKVYEYLRTIPKGKVVTYGQIAEHLSDKHLSRVVGNILHVNPDPDYYPCFRVVNREGLLAEHFGDGGKDGQKRRMERDGIEVINYKVDLESSRRKFL